jgi:serine/threonine-protein kinase
MKFPFDLPRDPQKRLLMILQDDPVPVRKRRPDLPAGLAEAVDRGLAREPGDRFPDVKALRQALLPFRKG